MAKTNMRKIEQEVLAVGSDFHGSKPFCLGECAGREGGSTEGAKDPNKTGGSSLASNLKHMLGM